MQSTGVPGGRLGFERMVPSVLLPPEDPSGPRARTARDWFVDISAALIAGLIGLVAVVSPAEADAAPLTNAWIAVEVVAGTISVLALFGRRNHPITVALFCAALSTVSAVAAVSALIGLFTVAVHRRFVAIVPVIVANVAAENLYRILRPTGQSLVIDNTLMVAVGAGVIGFGMFARARRQLVWTLQERAERAELEQDLLAQQARIAERSRIATEMHDVLGHRLALLALHAGGLEMRPDLPPHEVAETASLLRSTCHHALEDLRTVIGLLRDDESPDAPSTPQPTLSDIERLVTDTRRAGATVTLECSIIDLQSVPEAAGRVAYRVTQEALTNVAKHARGAAAVIEISGSPTDGLNIRIRNAIALPAPGYPLPGSGVGLIGLSERVELAGGTLRHGTNERDEFELEARLPWE